MKGTTTGKGYLKKISKEELAEISRKGGLVKSNKKKLASLQHAINLRHNWRLKENGCPTDSWIGLIKSFSNNPKELVKLFKTLFEDNYLNDKNKIKLIVAACEEQDIKDESSDDIYSTKYYGEYKPW